VSTPDLAVADLTVRFGGVTALDHVSFDVMPGRIHAVIGPNGAGKSTVFNTISNLVPLDEGSVHLAGVRIDGRSAHESAAAGVGRTFQNLGLFSDMTVEENLLLGTYLRGRAGWLACALRLPSATREARRMRAEVSDVAATVGISDLLKQTQTSLSYGDRKRVELARALCMRPTVLLLDEPVAGMNPLESATMTGTIRSINEALGLTTLLVEHDMNMVMSLADTVTVLNFGRMIADGPPDVVRKDPAVVEAYLGAPSDTDSSTKEHA